MRTQFKTLWTSSPPLTLTCLLMLAAFVLSVPAIWLDPRIITGMPAWMKPAKFAISTAIFSGTMAWIFGFVKIWPRTMIATGRLLALMLIVEVAIIDLQAARGVTSHFNVSTPLDGILFGVMGVSIGILWITTVIVMVALFREPFADRSWGWTLRLAMLITVLGSASGGLMVRATPEQSAAIKMGTNVPVIGAHTVGAPDGGPGLPALGWSRQHGDLRIPHFLGLHAIQALPLLFWLVSRRSLRMVWICGASYLTLFLILLWQALRGQSILQPDAATLWALGVWLGATGIAAVLSQLWAQHSSLAADSL
jgi:hypothetical protein